MACPTQGILDENLTFTIQGLDAGGSPVDTDTVPTYSVYEDETGTAITTGSMAKLDDAGTTGFYSEQIAVTTANGYERFKTYTIRIVSAINSISVAKNYSFICVGGSDTVTATTGALTTTANFKAFANITHSDDDTLILALINRATNAIHKYCGRTFVSATYREVRNGDDRYSILTNQYPIISIQMLALGTQDAFSITNTNSDAYNAYIQITSTTMTLVVQGGANAGSNELTLSSYATLSALKTAIEALDVGWSVNITSGLSVWDAAELLPASGLTCLDTYAYPQLPELNTFKSDFTFDADSGIIYSDLPFYKGNNNIVIKYTAGYTTIPANLEQICIDLVKTYYDGKSRDSALTAEKIGDYSYKTASESGSGGGNLPTSILERLSSYRRLDYEST